MDKKTLHQYNQQAAKYAATHLAVTPTRLRELMRTYFLPGRPTADIGCGSGRDADFLYRELGLTVTGFDASEGMLAEARKNFAGLNFQLSTLPKLENIADQTYGNVLSSATLMHLPEDQVSEAVTHLLRITQTGGRILLSFCPPRGGEDHRDADGRLYSPIDPGRLQSFIESLGSKVIFTEQSPDSTRPEISWNMLVIEK